MHKMSWPRLDTNKCILVQLLRHICSNNVLRVVNKFSLKRRPLSILKQVKLLSDLIVTKHFDYYWTGKWSKNYCIAKKSSNIWCDQTTCTFITGIINSPLKTVFHNVNCCFPHSANRAKHQTYQRYNLK